jgi:hypothetical protein
MLSNFTLYLPIFNEFKRLKHHRIALSHLTYATVIDAGSSDQSLDLINSWHLPNLRIRSIPNPESKARSPSWDQTVIADLQTKYFMIGNVGHVYSISLLRELDELCADGLIDCISIPNYHFFCNQLDSSFGEYRHSVAPSSIISRLLPLRKSNSSAQLAP